MNEFENEENKGERCMGCENKNRIKRIKKKTLTVFCRFFNLFSPFKSRAKLAAFPFRGQTSLATTIPPANRATTAFAAAPRKRWWGSRRCFHPARRPSMAIPCRLGCYGPAAVVTAAAATVIVVTTTATTVEVVRIRLDKGAHPVVLVHGYSGAKDSLLVANLLEPVHVPFVVRGRDLAKVVHPRLLAFTSVMAFLPAIVAIFQLVFPFTL